MKSLSNNILTILLCLLLPFGVHSQNDSTPIDVEIVRDPTELIKLSLKEYKKQNYAEAISISNKALSIYQSNGNLKKEGEVLENIGIFYAEFSDYENSINYLLKALKIAEAEKDTSAIHSRKFNIGTTFIEAGNFEKGIKFLNETIDYFQQTSPQNTAFLIACYSNLGGAYNGVHKNDSAMYFYQKAIEVTEIYGGTYLIGGPLLNIGVLYLQQSDATTALEYLQRALIAFQEDNDIKGEWHTNLEIAKAYALQGKTNEAITLIEQSILHFRKTNDLNYQIKAYNALSNIYRDLNDFEKALKYNDQLITTKDSISQVEMINQINNREHQYRIEKIVQENKNRLEVLEQKKKISTLRWYIATGILIIICLLSFILYSKIKTQKQRVETNLDIANTEQDKLKSELDYKTKELENFALHIVQKNEFLTEIKKSLTEIKSKSEKSKIKKINELHLKINQSIRRNKDLEILQSRIDDVNSQFFTTLARIYPKLTSKEKRLCAMLKMNLSSKEIASLNDISLGAVTMARYRLRKKLGMANETSFKEFFDNL